MARERHGGRPHATHGRDRWRPPASARAYAPPAAAGRPTGAPPPPARRPKTSWALRATRYGLPGAIVIAGIVAMCFATTAAVVGGASLIGAGLATALISWLYRVGVAGDAARDEEEYARSYFERFGRWPDERARPPSR